MLASAYGLKPTLRYVPEIKNAPGERLAELREKRRFSLRQVARLSEGAVSHTYVADLEKGVAPWSKASLETIRGLARAYDMSVPELLDYARGASASEPEEPEEPVARTFTKVARHIPAFRLFVPRSGKGELVRDEDELVPLDSGDEREFDAYNIEGEGLEQVTYVARRQNHARKDHLVVCEVPDRGILVAKIKAVEGRIFVLETLRKETIVTERIGIKGVVVFELKHFEEPPNGVN